MVIDGKTIAAKRLGELKTKIQNSETKPKLVAIIVGEDPASKMYVEKKGKKALEVGINSETKVLSSELSELKLIELIRELNTDVSVTGILVQLPFPKGSPADKNQREILDSIDPVKDVDCLTSVNMGLLFLGSPRYFPATVKGILTILEDVLSIKYHVSREENKHLLSGKKIVVIGRSDIAGKPLAIALINFGATVTVCNSRTENLSAITKTADILISATGVAGLVTKDMVKPGAIVVDAGINVKSDGKTVGDVDFAEVEKIALAISPVPGGVGPMTIVSLLENTFEALETLI